ncbi:unnamed protein product, partial [marine sediment metagenome]
GQLPPGDKEGGDKFRQSNGLGLGSGSWGFG